MDDDTLPACPGCGLSDQYTAHDGFCTCRECGFTVTPEQWRHLARTVAVAAAVDRIDTSGAMDVDVLRVRGVWKVRRRIGGLATLADALIALAEVIDG